MSFSYPAMWNLEKKDTPQGWVVTVQSPGTAFVMILCDKEMPDPEEMAETTLEALRSDYPGLDASRTMDTVAGVPAVGHEVDFISLDEPISCKTQSFPGPMGTILALSQMSGHDQKK